MMLSRYTHENLISLLGYCNEGGEMILVYEHASNGSLDRHLSSTTLTWTQRIKICLDAARGLSYLHEDKGNHHRILHRDIKSSNILLDENWNARVSDMGLAKVGPSNMYTFFITDTVGTLGYIDPLYLRMGFLTKESDVYSFGVVLFEVLCGRLCFDYSNAHAGNIVHIWKQRYEENKLDEIVFKDDLLQALDQSSLEMFSEIAFQCLQESREKRPKMSDVVEKLKIALKPQELVDLVPKEHQEIVKAMVPPLIYRSVEELKVLLSKGVLLNGDKRWLSITKKGGHIERIYIEACLNLAEIEARDLQHLCDDIVNSRFAGGRCYEYVDEFKARVRGHYLTPQISYTLNLVFRFRYEHEANQYNPLRYKVDGEDETKVFIIYPTIHEKDDGWFIAPLYQFTSQQKNADLQFIFEECCRDLLVAGFEFQPSEEKVERQVFEEYQNILEVSSQSLFYTSLDDLKQILSKGIHLNGYKTWFSLNEKGEHCRMISMKDCLIPNQDFPSRYESHCLSRFPTGLYDTKQKGFRIHVKTQLLNPLIPYTVNLVFSGYSSDHQAYIDLKYRVHGETRTSTVYLANWRKDEDLYMAELYQVTSNGGLLDLEVDFENTDTSIEGVEGILFQPLEKVEDQVFEDDKVEDIQPMLDLDLDMYWGQKLSNDLEEILKLSKHSVEGKRKKELYSMFCQGFLINNGQQWFNVDKNGKKCQMLPTRATCVIDDKNSTWESSNESRFGEVLVVTAGYTFEIVSDLKDTLLSPDTTYASYLVYNLPQDRSTFESPLEVSNVRYRDCYQYIYSYLVSPPNTPVIGQNDENSFNPLNRHRLSGLPRQRSDGRIEVKVWDFRTCCTPETVSMHLKLEHPVKKDLCGLTIQGIEVRPI